MSKRWLYLLPVVLFVVVAGFFLRGLWLDPKLIPSPMINKPSPEFSLPGLRPADGAISSASLKGQVTLVNFFASWCVPCRVEHPLLMELSRQGAIKIVGINYKDKPEDALAWLRSLGDPYGRIAADREGRVAIDWGVYGVPESYLVDREGRIQEKQVGPLSAQDWQAKFLPKIKELTK